MNGARAAVDEDRPGVGQHQADKHFHQRGLARPVLSQDAVDSAPVQGQVNLVAGDDAAEALGYSNEFDRRRRGVNPPGAGHRGRGVGHPPP